MDKEEVELLQRRYSHDAKARAQTELQRKKNFASVTTGITPWGLGAPALEVWLADELRAKSKSINWTPMLSNLSELAGIDLVSRCDEISKPPWAKVTTARDGTPLKNIDGITLGQIAHLHTLLDVNGIGYHAALYKSCDRKSPLMDMVWVRKIGEGAFGVVQLMKNRLTGEYIAVKLIKYEEDKLDRSSQEMAHHQRAAALSEYVVRIHTYGQIADEFLYVVMEYCAGGDLRHLLSEAGAPERGMADTALRWKLYLQICEGLEAIHSFGLIHLDVKPENSA